MRCRRSRSGDAGGRQLRQAARSLDDGLLTRATGNIIALSPPLFITGDQIDELFARLSKVTFFISS